MAAREHGLTYSAACEQPRAPRLFSKFRPRAGIAISGYNPHGLMIEYDKCGADIRGFTASSPKASTRSI